MKNDARFNMLFRYFISATFVVMISVSAGSAYADAAADSAQAKVLYDKATSAYALGDHASAAKYYEGAFKLKADQALLYNAAQAHRLAKNNKRAKELYTSYLRVYPNAQKAEQARKHLKTLSNPAQATTNAAPLEAAPPANAPKQSGPLTQASAAPYPSSGAPQVYPGSGYPTTQPAQKQNPATRQNQLFSNLLGEGPSHMRRDFMIAFALGVGSLRLEDSSEAGAAFAFDVGWFLHPNFAAMFDISAVSVSLDGGSISHIIYGAIGQLYLHKFIWVKGGLGLGQLSVSDDAGNTLAESDSSLALIVGAGFEFLQFTSGFALDGELRFVAASYDGIVTSNTSFMVGFNWY